MGVDSNYYLKHLKSFCQHIHSDTTANKYFMQDGTPSHTANITLNHLKDEFGRRFYTQGQMIAKLARLQSIRLFLLGCNQAQGL